MSIDIDHLLTERDPERLAPSLLDAADAEALLAFVLATAPEPAARRAGSHRRQVPVPALPQRRLAALGAVAAVAAGVLALGVALVPSQGGDDSAISTPTSSAPDVARVSLAKQSDGTIVAKITDPLRGAEQLSAAFRENGLNINVVAEPVSPSLVGTLTGSDFEAKLIPRDTPCGMDLELPRCNVGFVIPADFKGRGEVYVGRAAKQGENYQSTVWAFQPGEAFHCEGLVNAPVAKVAEYLEAHGVAPLIEQLDDPDGDGDGVATHPRATKPYPKGYIVSGAPLNATEIVLERADKPTTNKHYLETVNAGC